MLLRNMMPDKPSIKDIQLHQRNQYEGEMVTKKVNTEIVVNKVTQRMQDIPR